MPVTVWETLDVMGFRNGRPVLNCKETGKPGPCKGWKGASAAAPNPVKQSAGGASSSTKAALDRAKAQHAKTASKLAKAHAEHEQSKASLKAAKDAHENKSSKVDTKSLSKQAKEIKSLDEHANLETTSRQEVVDRLKAMELHKYSKEHLQALAKKIGAPVNKSTSKTQTIDAIHRKPLLTKEMLIGGST